MHLNLREAMGLETFDQNQVRRSHAVEQLLQHGLGARNLVQQRPAAAGHDHDLVGTSRAVAEAVLAWPIHVEAMMRMLDCGDG